MIVCNQLAIIPDYENGKNGTSTYSSNGTQHFYSCKTTSFMTQLFTHYHLSLPNIKLWSRTFLNTTYFIPILLSSKHIYIPVKFRKPLAPSDGAYGYVLLSAIQEVGENYILLTTGLKLEILSTPQHIKNKQLQAKYLLCMYEKYLLPFEPPRN